MSSGNTYRPPAVRTPNATATAYSASWLIDTAIRPMPSCSARLAARPLRLTDGWPGRQPLDLDLGPADPAHAQPQHLGHGLLRGPAPGEVLRPVADVAALALGQHPAREPVAEALDRVRDAVDLDDVDPELGRPLGDHARRHHGIGDRARARHRYSTVTDFARLRGWSTSVPRATAVW